MILLFFVACAGMLPPVVSSASVPEPEPQPPAVTAPPGSLWSEVQARALIGMDGNARRVGDLITVKIDETSTTSLGADTNTSRTSDSEFHVDAAFGLEASITKANPNMGGQLALGGGSATSLAGAGSTTRNGSLAAVVTCKVMEVLPNGNLRIRGTKEIKVNRETQFLALEGVVRPRDILLDNTVRSDLISDAHIEFTGAGVVAKDQGAGWATGIATALMPF